MYVHFDLIQGNNIGSAVEIAFKIQHWADRYKVSGYKTKIFKGTMRLTFENPEFYTVFSLTWNPEHESWLNFCLIEPMKTRQI